MQNYVYYTERESGASWVAKDVNDYILTTDFPIAIVRGKTGIFDYFQGTKSATQYTLVSNHGSPTDPSTRSAIVNGKNTRYQGNNIYDVKNVTNGRATLNSVYYYNSLSEYVENYYTVMKTTIPIFPSFKSAIKYFETGDDSEQINKPIPTDWKLYIDGDYKPLIKIVWKSETIESGFIDKSIDAENVYINIYTIKNDAEVDIANIKYTSGFYNTSYKKILELSKGDIATVIANLKFRIKWNFAVGGGGYALIPIKGEVTHYGADIDDGTTVTIIYGSGADDDGYEFPEDSSNVGNETESTQGYDSLGMLSTSYALTQARVNALAGFMWGSMLDSLKLVNNNPIENIVSCKIIPTLLTGTSKEIVLGNVATGVNGDVISKNIKITIGSINVSEFYNSFLDYAPYTKITIFIPYIGFKTLDCSLFMGKTLKIEYIIDVITGTCKALLYANDIYCQSFDGSCGIDIPITSSNRAQVESTYITGALGVVGELASGDIGGSVGGLLSTAKTQYHYNTHGSYNPSCGAFETKLCYLIIDRPTFQKPSSYAHDCGNPCKLTRKLSTLTGFTKCDSSIDLSGILATKEELKEIYELLTTGVYL